MSYILTALLIGLTIFFLYEMRYSMIRSSTTNRLITQYIDDVENPALLDEIYQYCEKDRKLSPILKKYNANPEDFKKLFDKLLLWGNFKKGRRFVPINSFFYVYSLEYLLKNKDEDAKKLTMKMMNFFHI